MSIPDVIFHSFISHPCRLAMICGIDSIQILFLLLFLFLLPKEYTAYDCKDYYNYNSYDNALYRRLLLLILLLIFPCHRIAVFICIGQCFSIFIEIYLRSVIILDDCLSIAIL